jgi:hypothetical protein
MAHFLIVALEAGARASILSIMNLGYPDETIGYYECSMNLASRLDGVALDRRSELGLILV